MNTNIFFLLYFDKSKEEALNTMNTSSFDTVLEEDKILVPFDGDYLIIETFREDKEAFIITPHHNCTSERYSVACSYIAYAFGAKLSNTLIYKEVEPSKVEINLTDMTIQNLESIADNFRNY